MTKYLGMEPKDLYLKAYSSGMEALKNAIPTPMIVYEKAIGLSDKPVPGCKEWYVPEGACGFAWINIKPARGKFIKYLKDIDAGHKSYYGGYDVWVHEGGQSLERKEAYASAFAKVLRDNGFDAYMMSRMD
jgi:hypothetical protein